MDPIRFDYLTRSLATIATRRRLLLRLAVLAMPLTALAPSLVTESKAAKRRRRQVRQRRDDHRQRARDEGKKKKKKKKCAQAGQTPQQGQGCCPGLVEDGAGQCAQPASPSCAQSCAGCCAGETCVTATSAAACGGGGIPCGTCSGLQGTCFNGACHCDVCASGCRYPSVQAAVADAGGPSTITVCAGTYTGNLTIARTLTLIGAGDGAAAGSNTILQGTGNGSVVTVNGGPITVELQGLRITGGSALQDGGGIQNFGAAGTVKLTDCTVIANFANDLGGGIANQGALQMEGCTVSENTAPLGGGGIFNSAVLTIESSTVAENGSFNGGGIFNAGSQMIVNDSTVSENTANIGGGIYNDSPTLTLFRSDLTLNIASLNGAGLYNANGSATLIRSNVVLNSASDGGGIFLASGTVNLSSGVVSGNSSNNCAPAGTVSGCTS